MAYIDDLQIAANSITTSSQNIEFVLLATQVTTATNNRCFSVPDVDSLPILTTGTNYPQGQIYFVESIGVPVISTDNSWIGLDGRTLRKDSINNQLWVWGTNTVAELGDGTKLNRCSPIREFCSAENWCTISGNAAINNAGIMFVWGRNSYGQIGDGSTIDKCSPVREFCSATDWCQVDKGPFNGVAIKTSGQLWTWGRNTSGSLGIGSSATIGRCSPVREFCSATDWCQASTGDNIMSAIKTTGQLWIWGSNSCGALGVGEATSLTSSCSPIREFCSATDWCNVSVGENSTVVGLKTTGQLWAWGNSATYGSVGDGTTVNKCSPVREFCSATDWCRIAAGSNTIAIKTSGEIWTWGSNGFGSAGIGSSVTIGRCSPVREFCSATDWCQISTSCLTVLALKTSGEVWGWGRNNCGQLGNGSTALSVCSPVREFSSFTNWSCISTLCCASFGLLIF